MKNKRCIDIRSKVWGACRKVQELTKPLLNSSNILSLFSIYGIIHNKIVRLQTDYRGIAIHASTFHATLYHASTKPLPPINFLCEKSTTSTYPHPILFSHPHFFSNDKRPTKSL